ncbi:MAG: LON peptidase substrate-binding domain-containing protein [Bryobacteraceae bacterium]|jgi:Lon protease-like protein
MRGELIPLFPLQVVLLPRAPLPLHVFEDRYKEMMQEVIAAEGEFGVVLSRENGILNTGCTATVERILRQFEDGRMDLLAVGQRRFTVLALDMERSFLRGQVEELEDDEFGPASPQKVREAIALQQEYARAIDTEAEPPDADEPELSFVLGAISPDLEFRQMLLSTRSEARRIELVAGHLGRLIKQHSIQVAMRRAARANGHGKHLKG